MAGLARKGAAAVRIDTAEFPSRLRASTELADTGGRGEWTTPLGERIEITDVRSIWYRRPLAPRLPPGVPRGAERFVERESTAALQGFYLAMRDRFWVNPPWMQRTLAADKWHQLRVARNVG